jgi:hypothetical protein
MAVNPELIREVFERSIDLFFQHEVQEVLEGVNERNNCGRMSIYLQQVAYQYGLANYFADTEYNRKQNGAVKTILDGQMKIVPINCDLLLHSRGNIVGEDNLIAVEVKKRDAPKDEKEKDRDRLRALTKASYDDIWSNDGVALPEHVSATYWECSLNWTEPTASVASSTTARGRRLTKPHASSKAAATRSPSLDWTRHACNACRVVAVSSNVSI